MSRHVFGQGAADWVVAIDGTTGDAIPGAATIVQLWTALSGGSQVTDLLDGTGAAVTTVTTDANGYLPKFSGPDTAPNDTFALAADANSGAGPRYWIYATDFGAAINSIASQQGQDVASIAGLNATAPVFVYYNTGTASYPVRPSTGAPVWWVGPNAPAFGGTGAVSGLDYWIGPSS